jgi:putative MATE family efflux protein
MRPTLDPDQPLGPQVWMFAKWPLLEQLMAFLVGFVDTALAGRLPTEAVEATNAIAVAAYLTWLMGLLQAAVGVGALALISRAVGGKHRREASAAVGQSIGMAMIWGTVIGIVFYIGAHPLGSLFNLSGRTLELHTSYLQILAISAPFMSVLFVGSACLRGAGDFRSPFLLMVLVNAVNIVVSIALVVGPEPIGGRGLEGIAIGTLVAWIIGASLQLVWLLTGRGGLRLYLHRLRPHKRMSLRIIRVSVPSLAENVLHWMANAVVVYVVGHLPEDPNAFGSHIIAIRIEALSYLPGTAFSQAAATMVGQCLGARQEAHARQAAWMCWKFGAGIMTVMGLAFIAVPEMFVLMLTDQPEFLATAPTLLRIAGFAQIGFGTAMVLSGAMRGAGDTRTTMLIGFVSMYLVRVPLVWIIGVELGYGLVGVWYALATELMFRGALNLARFMQGGWMKVKV